MGRSKKNRRPRYPDGSEIDLLSTAFNLPTRWTIQRAERRAAERGRSQYESAEDEDSEQSESDEDLAEGDKSDPSDVESVAASTTDDEEESDSSSHSRANSIPKHRSRGPSIQPRSILKPPRDGPHKTAKKASKSSKAGSKAPSTGSKKLAKKRAGRGSAGSFISPSASFSGRRSEPTSTPRKSQSRTSSTFSEATPSAPMVIYPQQPRSHYPVQPQFAYVPIRAPTAPQQYPVQSFVHQPIASYPQAVPSYYVPPFPTPPPQPPAPQHHAPHFSQPLQGILAHELKRLQQEIARKNTELSKKPGDAALEVDLGNLQSQLNSTLDAATAQRQASSTAKDAVGDFSDKQKTNEAIPVAGHASSVDQAEPTPTRNARTDQSSRNARGRTVRGAKATGQRERSPQRTRRHHLCSGCGEVRSAEYHAKHPVAPVQKPALNYCRDCLEQKMKRGDTGEYHFCFDCGKVRSKTFQQSHPIKRGKPFLPNYCGQCTTEMMDFVCVPDASAVVGNHF